MSCGFILNPAGAPFHINSLRFFHLLLISHKMLEKGVRVVESEVKKYLRKKLEDIIPGRF